MKFHVLKQPPPDTCDADTEFYGIDNSLRGDAPRCPRCDKYIGGMPLLPPVTVELESWGGTWGEMVIGGANDLLVSDRLKTALQRSDLSAFARYEPVIVARVKRHRRRNKAEPPVYWHCNIARSRAMVDTPLSGIDWDDPGNVCPECGIDGIIKRARRVVIQPGTWSGEDIFIARGLTGRILVTDRFKSFCEVEGCTNVDLIPAEDFSFDHYWNEGSKGLSS
jgi:hypothetical protein